jgi:hypothetical protein
MAECRGVLTKGGEPISRTAAVAVPDGEACHPARSNGLINPKMDGNG